MKGSLLPEAVLYANGMRLLWMILMPCLISIAEAEEYKEYTYYYYYFVLL